MRYNKVIGWIGFSLYLVVLLTLMFVVSRFGGMAQGYSFQEKLQYMSNFVPFETIGSYVEAYQNGTMNTDIIVRNLGGNMIAFTPFGFFLPFLFKRLRKLVPFLLVFVSCLFVLEVAQLLTARGSFDVDDFILNVPSALLGWSIFMLGARLFQRYEPCV